MLRVKIETELGETEHEPVHEAVLEAIIAGSPFALSSNSMERTRRFRNSTKVVGLP